jgi:Zn-dependent protease with chaperone function
VIPVEAPWRPWCRSCEWNLDAAPGPTGRAARSAARHEARARRLLRTGRRDRTGIGAWLALGLSTAAVAATGLVFVGALALLVVGRRSPVMVGLALILAAVAVVVRPRPVRLEGSAVVVDPERAPVLWATIADVADRLGGPRPDVVVVDLDANASIGRIGARPRAVLRLGLPLWIVLDPRQRLGLLAHELGHLAHRDPRQGRVVGLALTTLVRWRVMMTPPPMASGGLPLGTGVVLAGLRTVVAAWTAAIGRLHLAAVQRAELRSDRAAVGVAGYGAYVGLLRWLARSDHIGHATRIALVRRDGVDFVTSLLGTVRALPAGEAERLDRLAERAPYDPGASHPPVRLRLQAIDDLDAAAGTIPVDADRWATIDTELAPLLATLVDRGTDAARARHDRFTGHFPPRQPAGPQGSR